MLYKHNVYNEFLILLNSKIKKIKNKFNSILKVIGRKKHQGNQNLEKYVKKN